MELVKAQGGDVKTLANPKNLLSKKTIEVKSTEEGYIMDIDALDIGKAAMRLGAGRETKEDDILLDVGLDLHQKIGNYVKVGDVLATLYVRNKGIEEASTLVHDAITIGKTKKTLQLIKKTIK